MKSDNYYGEKYREKSFIPDKYGNNIGCYNTFEINKDFKKVKQGTKKFERMINILYFNNDKGFLNNTNKEDIINDFEEIKSIEQYNSVFYNKKIDLLMGYYWDGDGTLAFIDKKKRIFINTDCKKDYIWEEL